MRDKWSEWLLEKRFVGVANRREMIATLSGIREELIRNAGVREGDSLLDVGCGDGFVGFGALPIVGAKGKVIFSDISTDLLKYCEEAAVRSKVGSVCSFVEASADKLSAIASMSCDVVVSRSVLMYVEDKKNVFESYYRVLRKGGRISLFEPVNRLRRDSDTPAGFLGYEIGQLGELASRLLSCFGPSASSNTGPMYGWDERSLMKDAIAAGFPELNMTLRCVYKRDRPPCKWDSFLDECRNPEACSIREAMDEVLSAEEAQRFSTHFRPLVEQGIGLPVSASFLYLWGTK